MDRLNGTVNINLSLSKVNYLNELIERDRAKALVEYTFNDGTTSLRCPICERFITGTPYAFCPDCGQRLDIENIAL